MSRAIPTALSCSELVELVTDFLENRMTADERVRFEQHLVACDGCTEYVRQMRRTIATAGKLTEESIPESKKEDLLRLFRTWKAK